MTKISNISGTNPNIEVFQVNLERNLSKSWHFSPDSLLAGMVYQKIGPEQCIHANPVRAGLKSNHINGFKIFHPP